MKDFILKILNDKLKTAFSDQGYHMFDYLSETDCEAVAKDIESHVMKFVEWTTEAVILNYHDKRYYTRVDFKDIPFDSSKELYDYWKTNIDK